MNYSEWDYREMFEALGFDLPRKSKGNVKCPQHTDNHPSMCIDVSKGLFYCFSCGWKGYVPKVYFETYGKQFQKHTALSMAELQEYYQKKDQKRSLHTVKKFFTATSEKRIDPILKKWLDFRGINPVVADNAGVFYGNVSITYLDEKTGKNKTYTVFDRVMFPIYNEKKEMCSIEMRFPFFGQESEAFKNTVPKVLYPKCSSVNLLYEQSKLVKTEKLYILEGLMDCLAFRSLTNLKNTTSIFGARFTEHQKDVLNEFPEICYVYNNDMAGLESVKTFKEFYKGKMTLLKPYGNYDDVGDMAKAKFTEVKEWLQTEH